MGKAIDLEALSKPLDISQIDFRIQNITKNGWATILPYKDARVDMQRLDEACGALNWKREHNSTNHNCVVSIWCDEKGQWISKEDTGTESFTEKEKGLASDSFKRACFNWGIGRELYDYPVIRVQLKPEEYELFKDRSDKERARATYKLRLSDWVWQHEWRDGVLAFLEARDGQVARYTYYRITPKQVEDYMEVVASGNALDLILMQLELGEEVNNQAFNAAPPKQKTKFKETVRKMTAEGWETIGAHVDLIAEHLEKGDPYAGQLWDELSATEKKLVWSRLTDIQHRQIKTMIEEAA